MLLTRTSALKPWTETERAFFISNTLLLYLTIKIFTMEKRVMPSLDKIKRFIGANYDAFVALLGGTPMQRQPLVIPQVTTTQRDAIEGMDNGYMVFNTVTNQFNYYDEGGGEWLPLEARGPEKNYLALLNAVGTAAPTPNVLKNDNSAPIVWARTGTGTYTGTLTNAFTSNTVVFSGNPLIAIVKTSANVVTLTARNLAGVATDGLTDAAISIIAYP